jgi:radical SAM protein with 4Fe4S-binding SPASM domain
MMTLLSEMTDRALHLGVPISVHLDVTYRCNERCVHCYLDHDDKGEMTTAEIQNVLAQLAEAGTFQLALSGGEVFMRRDFFDIVAFARELLFSVKVKTNGVMIGEPEAQQLAKLAVQDVQISIYSDQPEIHDGITKLPGSLRRSLRAIRLLKENRVRVTIANVLMSANLFDDHGVRRLAKELDVSYVLDPVVTPKLDGDTATLAFRAPLWALQRAMHDPELLPNSHDDQSSGTQQHDAGEDIPCSAGHNSCYISPYGDVYPCVQFPLSCGNVRRQAFLEIWRTSPKMTEIRAIRNKHLNTCSSCTHMRSCSRCPGLAYMEGDMRGPSSADCQQSLAKTGVPSASMLRLAQKPSGAALIQIQPAVTLSL